MLILVCGLPGSGKTHFSKSLANRLGAEHISSDEIRMKVLEKRTYSQEEKDRIYGMMALEAGDALSRGKDAVLDATFYLARYRAMMEEVAEKEGTGFEIIECMIDEEQLKDRMEKRGMEKSQSEADYQVYLKVKAEFEPISQEHLEIDTSRPLEENLEKAIEWIRNR